VILNLGNTTNPLLVVVGIAVILSNSNGCGKVGTYGGFTDMTHTFIQDFVAAAIAGNTTAAGTMPFNHARGLNASWILLFAFLIFFD
jgi:hypothetical protein